jgi:hypothetical protein
MTWIAPQYLSLLMDRAASNPEPPGDPELVNEALQYAAKALDSTVAPPDPEPAVEPALPEGEFGRIEMPGFRQHTGWVTEATRFGAPVAIVRNWDGQVEAEVGFGAGCRFVHLPTPLKRPEPRPALGAGFGGGTYCEDDDEYADDDKDPF